MAEHHSRWKMAVCYHCRALNHAPIMAWRAPESPSCAAEEVIKRSLDGQSRESLRNTPSLGKSLHLKQVVSVFRIDRAFSISQNSHCGSCENISVRILWEAKWEFHYYYIFIKNVIFLRWTHYTAGLASVICFSTLSLLPRLVFIARRQWSGGVCRDSPHDKKVHWGMAS